MKKILVLGVGAIGSVAVAFALSAGIASADDGVVGQTYKEAKTALSQKGVTPVVASTVGDRKDQDACIVISAFKEPAVDGFGKKAKATMNVNLNCYATNGSATQPGFSVASPEGQKQYKLDQAAKSQKEAAAAAAADQSAQGAPAATDVPPGGQ